jgi:hypothetical protein
VKFRTFLRTFVHELVHHLDVTGLGLPDSFHAAGFFRRESSLVRQLLGEAQASEGRQFAVPLCYGGSTRLQGILRVYLAATLVVACSPQSATNESGFPEGASGAAAPGAATAPPPDPAKGDVAPSSAPPAPSASAGQDAGPPPPPPPPPPSSVPHAGLNYSGAIGIEKKP